jgi:CO/xanthine dehydrogenase FAD-binding subunit
MVMQPFEFVRAASLEQAVALLGQDPEAAVLAGGTELLALMKDGAVRPRRLVSIRRLEGISGVRAKAEGGLALGALLTLEELAAEAAVGWELALLRAAAARIASPQVRNLATLGGNLCQRSPPGSTLAPLLVALGAQVVLFGSQGEWRLPLSDFYRPAGGLKPGEILTEIIVPPLLGRRAASYRVSGGPGLDWPAASAAVVLAVEEEKVTKATVVVGQVTPAPWIAVDAAAVLAGKTVDESSAKEAAVAAGSAIKTLTGDPYRAAVAQVAVQRALRAAVG